MCIFLFVMAMWLYTPSQSHLLLKHEAAVHSISTLEILGYRIICVGIQTLANATTLHQL